MDTQLIIAPLMGLVIGGITNSLAIKMLFRPQNPLFIGKFRLPLTPGLIPKEQPHIAKSLGDTVARELLNIDVMHNTLTSDSMQEKVGLLADNIFAKYASSEYTVSEELTALFGREATEDFINGIYDKLTEMIYQKLNEINFGEDSVNKAVSKSIAAEPPKGIFKRLASSKTTESITKPIAAKVYKKLAANSLGMIKGTLHSEGDKLLSQKTGLLVAKYEDKLPYLRSLLIENYNKTIHNDLPKILEAINIAKIVEDRINALNPPEIEALINEIAKKELNAIVAFGAVLGFLMGFFNVLIENFF